MAEGWLCVGRTCQQVTHTNIGTLVGWCPKLLIFQTPVWCAKGQSVGIRQLERHLATLGTGEIVGKVEIDTPTLISGHWYALSVDAVQGGWRDLVSG
jgi:hypothetical protein